MRFIKRRVNDLAHNILAHTLSPKTLDNKELGYFIDNIILDDNIYTFLMLSK